MNQNRIYICIDLKSFYASVECRERGLDPMTTNLVVADPERTDKTICLAVSPAMKALGVPGRLRVFEIPAGIDYIMAPPRMKLYMEYSAQIYSIYLKYISKDDIHVYSIDEIMCDVTNYLDMYQMGVKELAMKIMDDVYVSTGITATCGIGPNLYLAKVALDIMAKHAKNHIAMLDEDDYKKYLWQHKPLRDFWRIGPGIAERLAHMGITTMEEIAHASEDSLYHAFGVEAELLIDHAWGREPVTIADIKAYKPKSSSIGSGQVLGEDVDYEGGRLIVKEMADLLSLELVDQGLMTDSITLNIGYGYRSELKPANGTIKLPSATSSTRVLIEQAAVLYDRIVNREGWIHRFNMTFNHVSDEMCQQYDLFTDPAELEKERRLQKAMLEMKDKFGKNAILKGMNLQKGATAMERNRQIGGHRSGSEK